MENVWIVDYLRTPIGRQGGVLKGVRPDDLAAHVIKTLVMRTEIDPLGIDEVVMGCVNQAGEDNRNVARMAVLLAGLPVEIPAVTVNRLCASGLEAVNQGARSIMVGDADVVVAGGVESMTRAPWVLQKPDAATPRGNQTLWDTALGWRMANPDFPYPTESMGETAENVAQLYQIDRVAQDEFAFLSQKRAAQAVRSGILAQEIAPIEVKQGKQTVRIDQDEHPRPETTMEGLAALRPAFKSDGTVTAGNSAGINDGAAALLLVSERRGRELGVKPLARIRGSVATGVHPSTMGLGPISAVRKLMVKMGLTMDEIDWFELNEAFAAQALACIRELSLPIERVNPHGGAISLGHPLGCSGARILGALALQLQRSGARYGVATLCVGLGQGVATLLERVE